MQVQKLFGRFCESIQGLGFQKARKDYCTKVEEHWGYWIRLAVSDSPATGFEIDCGIRVLNEALPALHLNGLHFKKQERGVSVGPDDPEISEQDCLMEIETIVREKMMPFFSEFSAPESLLGKHSPLHEIAKAGLRKSLKGHIDEGLVMHSLRLLGRAPTM
jgi:hypothetical protein